MMSVPSQGAENGTFSADRITSGESLLKFYVNVRYVELSGELEDELCCFINGYHESQ